MRIVTPEIVESADLSSSNVVNEYADWNSADTYNQGDRRVFEQSVYESLTNSNTDDPPDEGAAKSTPTWLRLGYSNTWRMFRDGIDSQSTGTDEIDATVSTKDTVPALAVLGAVGSTVRARMIDATDGTVYDETRDLIDAEVDNPFDYFYAPYRTVSTAYFNNMPAYPGADIRIQVTAATASDPVAIGRVVFGIETEIGSALIGSELSRKSYSVKERDEFGNLTNVPRRTIRIIDYDIQVPAEKVDSVDRLIDEIDGVPTLFVGSPDLPESLIFGLSSNFRVLLRGFSVSECNLKVEGF